MASPKKRNTKTRSLFASQPGQRAHPVAFVRGPNPDLPKFIAEHSTPYNSQTDKYNVPAFDLDCQIDNAAEPKDLFDLHFYKGKKHWTAIREHIRHYLPSKYYPKGTGLVLDCFSGSGMTGVAAMMEGRPCVLIDASPAAVLPSGKWSATHLDECLQHERVDESGHKRVFEASADTLPDGTFIVMPGSLERRAGLLLGDEMLPWSPEAYLRPEIRPRGVSVSVVTPRSTVRALSAGYKPAGL